MIAAFINIMDPTGEAQCLFDVFFSFRGIDTRSTITSFLYDALRDEGLNPFMDDEVMKSGDQISHSLLKAIEESRISIVVLSENYASSSWCLDELVKILETRKMVWPIFYKVPPSDVRYQTNRFGEAMAPLEQRFRNDSQQMKKWRSALFEVSFLKGWYFKTGCEYHFLPQIVKQATALLCPQQLYADEHLIGHQSRLATLESLLDIESRDIVCMIGVHGTGGIGKTTLVKALYNLISDQFECAIFLDSVKETSSHFMGLQELQKAFLYKLGENINFGSVDELATRLKHKLCRKRVLLVLDDVDNEEHLGKLAGSCNWFGSGSRIIITTRDKHLLLVHRVEKRYEMKELNDHEALQLFCWNAFKMNQPAPDFEDVSNRAVHYAQGLPLALKVIGSNLFGKSVLGCKSALEQYERIPDRKIYDILKISYDCLEENAKNVFLDIACFFKWKSLKYVEKVLDKCGFFPAYNIGLLVDKSLLTIEDGHLRMHDLIQDMGKEVVKLEALTEPGKRSRLCFHEDVLRVLTENSGSSNIEGRSNIEGIILDPPKPEEVEWSGTAFETMNNLRILIVRKARFSSGPVYLPNSLRLLEWEGYPVESLQNIPRNAVVLSLPGSDLRLDKKDPFPELMHLTHIDFSRCKFVTHMPDVSRVPNLTELRLDECENLIAVHPSVGLLEKLVVLSASHCRRLRTFLATMWLPSLESLTLYSTRFKHFPNIVGVMDKPLTIRLGNSSILEFPRSTCNLKGLESLDLCCCKDLIDLPSNLFMLPNIAELNLSDGPNFRASFRRFQNSHGVTSTSWSNVRRLYFERSHLTDEDLDLILKCFPHLEELEVSYNGFESLPAIIKESANLRVLNVTGCEKLQKIPELPSSIQKVAAICCPSLTSETSKMLWSQAFTEVYRLEVRMPGTTIPDWFYHRCEGDTLSFWARGKFPVVALAFFFTKNKSSLFLPRDYAQIKLYINGEYVSGYINGSYDLDIEKDSVLLCDLRSQFKEEKWHNLDMFHASEWNYVEVKCVCTDLSLTLSHCGAHVYKQQTNKEDIQFTCPNP